MKSSLCETPTKQAAFEQMAYRLITAWASRCLEFMPKKMDRWKGTPVDLYLLPAVTLDCAYPKRRKGLSKLDSDIQKFIKSVRHTAMEAAPQYSGRIGDIAVQWNENRITLYFGDDAYEDLNAEYKRLGYLTNSCWARFLASRFSTIVHELEHAYTEWASGGRWTDNVRSQRAIASRIKAYRSNDPELQQQRHADYLNDPIEISARYRDTLAKLGIFATQSSWRDFLAKFRYEFEGWRELPKKDQRRLTLRLAHQWLYAQRPRGRDVTDEVRQLQDRLRQKYGLVSLYIYYRKHHDVVEIDSFGTKDQNIRDDILWSVLRFADIRRKRVSVQEMPFSPYAKKLGFVKQQSRNKDYSLPLGTTMYRPARERRIGDV